MRKARPSFTISASSPAAILSENLPVLTESWLLACDINQHSARTIGSRRDVMHKFVWFLRHREICTVGVNEIRQFLYYLGHGHKEPGGRWGNPLQTKPVTSGTIKT